MSRKKYFDVIYLSSNIDNNVCEIFLDFSITYKDYFCLTKLIHSAFINYQYGINNFIKTNAHSVFLTLSNTNIDSKITSLYAISFATLKKCLSSLKKSAINNFKIVKDYNEAITNERMLNFIEGLANDDIRYKNSSIRQIKSHYIRQCQLYRKNYCQLLSEEIFIDSISLIFKYFDTIKKLCLRYSPLLGSSQNMVAPMETLKILAPIQDFETSTQIECELFSTTMELDNLF